MTGKKCGRLKVLKRVDSTVQGRAQFLCLCDCGKEITVLGKNIRSGNTKSCGCRRHDGLHTTHGMSKTNNRLYNIWLGMKQRCYYKKHVGYKRYGARGIMVEKRWHKFENFFADMSESHSKHLSIHGKANTTLDRIDNDGDYSQQNCKWSTRREQWLNSISNK